MRRLGLMPVLVVLALIIVLSRPTVLSADIGPSIDLNGEGVGIDYSATFTENSEPKPIVSVTGLAITNSRNIITGAKAKITNAERPDKAVEKLGTSTSVAGLAVSYSTNNGELTVTGTATIEKYEELLRSLTYHNTSDSPDITDRKVSITVSDGQAISPAAVSTVTVAAVNDAPVLETDCNMVLDSINEDVIDSKGNSVTTIIKSAETTGLDCITDADAAAQEGFAIIGTSTGNGEWQYSIDGGSSWLPFGTVSNNSAVLLDGGGRIRFVPLPNFNGSASFTLRAWDGSGGKPSGETGVDTAINGGSSSFSKESGTATILIASVNDLPIVDLNGSEPNTSYTTQFFEGGQPVPIASFAATITDDDHSELQKLTVTLTNRPNGTAESLAADTTSAGAITVVPYNSSNGMLVLNGPASKDNFALVLRKITYGNTAADPASVARTLTVVAYDGINDGPIATTTITISPPNRAPVLDPEAILTLGNVDEDATQPAGMLISSILAAAGDPITDEDSGAQEGLAAIGADATNGQWQYSTKNPPAPADWLPVGSVSGTAALLLNDAAWLRFVPAPNYSGPSGPLTFRAWDRTAGGNGQRDVNVSEFGGNTAYSVNTNTISANVTGVNDPPLLGGLPTAVLTYVEDDPPLNLLSDSFTLTDPDSPTLSAATVKIANPLDGDAEWLFVETGNTGIMTEYFEGVLSLSGSASPSAYQQVLRTLRYRNTSQDPDPTNRVIEMTASDGQSSRPPVSLVVQVQPVNDPPMLDLDGIGPNLDYATVHYINRGPSLIVAPSLVVTDPDNTTIRLATIRITNPRNGAAEVLAADTDGAGNIKSNYDAATSTLSLTGVDTVANYQLVLRTITYDNTLAEPDDENRVIEFVVADATTPSEVRRSTVSLVVAPNVQLFMPITAWAYRRAEEPNDTCSQAMGLYLNVNELFRADDAYDWFYFDLPTNANLTVELRDFTPQRGQIIVYREKEAGQACLGPQYVETIGHNGTQNTTEKIVPLGQRPAGRYYIWLINDGVKDPNSIYKLYIRALATP